MINFLILVVGLVVLGVSVVFGIGVTMTRANPGTDPNRCPAGREVAGRGEVSSGWSSARLHLVIGAAAGRAIRRGACGRCRRLD